MRKIRWGIIGCGDVTEIKSGPALNLVDDSELAAVMRRDGAKAKDYAKRHNVKKWYTDVSELINDEEINAIYVATPPAYHEDYTLAAFRAGKPVYVEKPMALDASQCARMKDASEKYSCKLSIAHYRRAQQKFLKVKSLLQENTLGDITAVNMTFTQPYQVGTENTWRTNPAISGGGLFHDLAPHQLDLMLYFFGPALKVQGTALNRANLYDADDFVSAEILFNNDILFKGLWDFNCRQGEESDLCEITGTNGKLRFSVFGNYCELITNNKADLLEFDHLIHVQQPMIDQVVKYFLDKAPNPCPPEDGVEVMKMMDILTGKNSS